MQPAPCNVCNQSPTQTSPGVQSALGSTTGRVCWGHSETSSLAQALISQAWIVCLVSQTKDNKSWSTQTISGMAPSTADRQLSRTLVSSLWAEHSPAMQQQNASDLHHKARGNVYDMMQVSCNRQHTAGSNMVQVLDKHVADHCEACCRRPGSMLRASSKQAAGPSKAFHSEG